MTFWDSLRQDLHYALRTLSRAPGYTIATCVTLALGIGANTAIFSVVHDVLLRPLPYADGDALVRIVHTRQHPAPSEAQLAVNERLAYARELRSIEAVAEYHSMPFVLLRQGEPDEVDTGVVSSNYFDVLGVTPLHGRGFADADDDPGAEPVLLLSHAYWTSKFGADPGVVGQTLEMNEMMHTVIGVLPPVPAYPESRDVYMTTAACPMRAMAEHEMAADPRTFPFLLVFGRLAPGATLEAADAEVQTVAHRLAAAAPQAYRVEATGFSAGVVGLNEEMVRDARPILLGLLAATSLVLLIACANVANLSLARLIARDREFAVRTALGAGLGRVTRQLLTEGLLISIAGGAAGLLLAPLLTHSLATFAARFTPRALAPSLDAPVLGFTLILALAAGLIVSVVPVLSARRVLPTAVRESAARIGETPRRRRTRAALVVAQVALCFALLVCAGLFLDSLRRLAAVDLGFRPGQVLTARVPGNWSHHRLPTAESVDRFYGTIAERLDADPSVTMWALTNAVPLSDGSPFPEPVRVSGAAADSDDLPRANRSLASERYFDILGVPLLRGRAFTPFDRRGSAPVAIINQAMVRLWNERDPLGSQFTAGNTTFTVVGIVGDVRHFGVARAALPQYYTPFWQAPGSGATRVLMSGTSQPMTLLPVLKHAVYAADATAPIEQVDTLDALLGGELASPRLNAILLAGFAGVALLITLAGLGGAIATSVSQRTREFGLRTALGASRGAVLRMVFGQALGLVGAGVVAGAASGAAISRALASRLYETTPLEPGVYVAVAALFLVAAAAACFVPARRASTVDPLIAMRAD